MEKNIERPASTSSTQNADVHTPAYFIAIHLEPSYEQLLDEAVLYQVAAGVLAAEGVTGPLEMGVVVTTDDEVRALNRDYLGHDYETDVISFGPVMGEQKGLPGFVTPAERPPYLGDVAISYDRAAEQAPDYKHSVEQEVAVLLIHGTLHLLGYDDLNDADRARMHARQDELLAHLYEV